MRVTVSCQDVTRVEADIFVASLGVDERPPRGLAGKIDWYLGGFISRLLIEENIAGEAGERTLVAIQQKLSTPRLLLLGLGRSDKMEQKAVATQYRGLGATVRDLGLVSTALEVPLVETPKSTIHPILDETFAGFREAYRNEGEPLPFEIQVLARTEEESNGWRRVIRHLMR